MMWGEKVPLPRMGGAEVKVDMGVCPCVCVCACVQARHRFSSATEIIGA